MYRGKCKDKDTSLFWLQRQLDNFKKSHLAFEQKHIYT